MIFTIVAALMALSTAASAHSGIQPSSGELQWSFEPGVIAALALAAIGYGLGFSKLAARRAHVIGKRWRGVAFWIGLAVLALACYRRSIISGSAAVRPYDPAPSANSCCGASVDSRLAGSSSSVGSAAARTKSPYPGMVGLRRTAFGQGGKQSQQYVVAGGGGGRWPGPAAAATSFVVLLFASGGITTRTSKPCSSTTRAVSLTGSVVRGVEGPARSFRRPRPTRPAGGSSVRPTPQLA